MELDTIVIGDCLDVMAEMPDGCVDLVVADPPFAAVAPSVLSSGTRTWAWRRSYGDFNPMQRWWDLVSEEIWRILGQEGQAYCFCDAKTYSIVYPAFYEGCTGVVQALVWDKGRINLGKHYRSQTEFIIYARGSEAPCLRNPTSNLLYFKPIPGQKRLVSTQKPCNLVRELIRNSTGWGNLVFDPFIGSGTTAIAAMRQGCHFYGCDINPDYVELANKRIEKAKLEMSQLNMDLTNSINHDIIISNPRPTPGRHK